MDQIYSSKVTQNWTWVNAPLHTYHATDIFSVIVYTGDSTLWCFILGFPFSVWSLCKKLIKQHTVHSVFLILEINNDNNNCRVIP